MNGDKKINYNICHICLISVITSVYKSIGSKARLTVPGDLSPVF